MHDPKHPIWPILRLAVLMLSLLSILYFTATHFDETEVKTLVGAFLTAGSVEGLSAFLTKK